MANKTLALLCLLAVATQARPDGTPAASDAPATVCGGHVPAPAHCEWVAGTLSVYNGTPAVRIKVHGRRKTYGVGPSEDEWMPAGLKGALTPDNAIEGRFRVCTMPDAPPRGLPMVCVDDAKVSKVTPPAAKP